jgi:sirohydrochlorin cobaltochelatase
MNTSSVSTPQPAVIVFAHGSRDPQWRQPIENVARRISERSPGTRVVCAYLELVEPDLSSAIDALAAEGVRHIRMLPVFFGVGRHAREDLPLLLAAARARHPQLLLDVLPAAGEQQRLIDLLATLALESPAS